MAAKPLGLAVFTSLVGETFSVELAGGVTVDLRLTSVTPASDTWAPGPLDRDRFSLLFAGPHTVPLGQGTYPFSHPEIGTSPIFIVPVAREADGFLYEAIFN